MRNIVFIILLLFGNASASENIVPENILKTWGYETSESNDQRQSIKRIKGESWGDDQVYYPRFVLSKSCYESSALATISRKEVIEQQKNDPFRGFKSHHDSFISSNCLYEIFTGARTTYLNYQPRILKEYKGYIQNANKP